MIASKTPKNDYSAAIAMQKNIDLLNQLYQNGHYILLFTARGFKTGIDWSQTTKKQLEQWGVQYNELAFGKPDADIYIDDKFFELFNLVNLI